MKYSRTPTARIAISLTLKNFSPLLAYTFGAGANQKPFFGQEADCLLLAVLQPALKSVETQQTRTPRTDQGPHPIDASGCLREQTKQEASIE